MDTPGELAAALDRVGYLADEGLATAAFLALRTRRLAHAVLWVNPHVGRSGYAPVQSGIRAALPHVDWLLAGHSLATLDELLTEVRRA